MWQTVFSENVPVKPAAQEHQVLYYKAVKRLQIHKVNVIKISNKTINKTNGSAKALLKNKYNSHRETQEWCVTKRISYLATEQL